MHWTSSSPNSIVVYNLLPVRESVDTSPTDSTRRFNMTDSNEINAIAQRRIREQEKLDAAARTIDLLTTEEIDAIELYINAYDVDGLKTVFRFIREVRRDRDPSPDKT
jgi:hypothetical protein